MEALTNGASSRMPSMAQTNAMEAKACQFADALLSEGMALDAPDKNLMTRLLTLRACAKVIARISRLEAVVPSLELGDQMRFWPRAVEMAIKEDRHAAVMMAAELSKVAGAS